MNATLTLPARESWILRDTPPIYHANTPQATTRVAVFGSFMGGYHVLKELLEGPLANRVKVVGVATDDPTQPFTNARKRLWQYPHSRDDELLVPCFAVARGLPVFTGRVKSPGFLGTYLDDWQPQLCLMATFGQKIPTALITYPSLGFCNFHHSGVAWPSYPGPDPIAAMVRDGRTHLVLTIHRVTDVIDGGEFVARSHQVAIPQGINAIGMHRITWPQMGPFIRQTVGSMLRVGEQNSANLPSLLHDAPVPYVCRFPVIAQCSLAQELEAADSTAHSSAAGDRPFHGLPLELIATQGLRAASRGSTARHSQRRLCGALRAPRFSAEPVAALAAAPP